MSKENFTRGLKGGVPIALGYLAVSFTFGIAAFRDGLSIFEASLIPLVNVTSAGQFAGLSIIAEGGTLLEMALTQFIINLRYSLMSLALSQRLSSRTRLFHRFIMAFGTTDEIFGISALQKYPLDPAFQYGAMAISIPAWVLGTFLGALAGNLLPEFLLSALSVAIYGMFLAIILPPAKQDSAVLFVILLAMAISSVLTAIPGLSSGFIIIIATVFTASLAALLHPVKEEEETQSA